jgi:hypothetical protein
MQWFVSLLWAAFLDRDWAGSVAPVKCNVFSRCVCNGGCRSPNNFAPIPVRAAVPEVRCSKCGCLGRAAPGCGVRCERGCGTPGAFQRSGATWSAERTRDNVCIQRVAPCGHLCACHTQRDVELAVFGPSARGVRCRQILIGIPVFFYVVYKLAMWVRRLCTRVGAVVLSPLRPYESC